MKNKKVYTERCIEAAGSAMHKQPWWPMHPLWLVLVIVLFIAAMQMAGCTEVPETDDQYAVLDEHGGRHAFRMDTSLVFIESDPFTSAAVTRARIRLGKILFHDPLVSLDAVDPEQIGMFSCASCHADPFGFSTTFPAIGEGGVGFFQRDSTAGVHNDVSSFTDSTGKKHFLKSPTALNVAYGGRMLWNGSAGSLAQAGTFHQTQKALAAHHQQPYDLLCSLPRYAELFRDANLECDGRGLGRAIEVYERSLQATQAPFQQWLRGDVGLGEEDLKAVGVFMAACADCHRGPGLMKDTLATFGYDAFGPRLVKTPYNASDHTVYGPLGTFNDLGAYLAAHSGLSGDSLDAARRFVEVLVHDPALSRYRPRLDELPRGEFDDRCIINNDAQSRIELGCE